MKVLVVDDHALVRRGMGHVIRECFSDAEVLEAGSAADALEKLSTGSIDIALVDVRMPDADGLVLRALEAAAVVLDADLDRTIGCQDAHRDLAAVRVLGGVRDAFPDHR